jgi:hypothetical protein
MATTDQNGTTTDHGSTPPERPARSTAKPGMDGRAALEAAGAVVLFALGVILPGVLGFSSASAWPNIIGGGVAFALVRLFAPRIARIAVGVLGGAVLFSLLVSLNPSFGRGDIAQIGVALIGAVIGYGIMRAE